MRRAEARPEEVAAYAAELKSIEDLNGLAYSEGDARGIQRDDAKTTSSADMSLETSGDLGEEDG